MDKKTLVFSGIMALMIGYCVALWVNRVPIIPAIEARHTDQITQAIEDSVESVTARIKEQDSKVKTEVRFVYEKTRSKVNALSADAVSVGLNDELSVFRGMEDGAGELYDD
jgi:hypothetical protein